MTVAAGIALFVARGVFAVGSGASGGGSRFTGNPEKEARRVFTRR
jgi:hypothetical protein